MEYKRECPECGKELTYWGKGNLNRAIRNNSVCVNCRKMPESLKKKLSEYWKGKPKKTYKRKKRGEKSEFYKKCPDCGELIYYSRKSNLTQAIRRNTKCPKCVMKHRIEEHGKPYLLTQEQINKMAATKAGYDTFEEYMEALPEFKKYKRNVMSITYKQPLETLENYDKKGRMGEEGAYNIDHIYSIYNGFMNNIPAEKIGHIDNLQMIPWLENIQKWKN